ncbi:transmembrane channel-like protein [Plutella xylostella]|uniref:transmembrane channel-like protein n=1 Tax=Plutella xylostella TaxID=51655 RepID=UPI0020328BBA|nr:transmembrane channel-like protein [Plutella xylostella]
MSSAAPPPPATDSPNEVKFSPTAGDGSEDEDYSASLSAVLRQRRASVRRSRKGRARRPSSPFMADEPRGRRRSSAFTSSSGDTAISMEEGPPGAVTQEQIFQNIHLHKEVLVSVKQQPLGMRRKLKIVHQAKGYIKRHEGQLQERLAQSKCTRDIYARFNILINTKWQQLKREAANTSNVLIPWELRIKEIESHFGSVVASYFTFLRWLFWVNLVIGFILMVFVIVPEYVTAKPHQDGERKIIMEEERGNATNLLTLWEFEGVLKCSPIFYGYYTNVERAEYRMPLAYFLTGLVVYIYSFVATLRKMAENSRMSKLSEKEDECIFSWKLFTGWDFMIGNAETAHNRIASVILSFKEALLEEAEKKKDLRNWRIISLRAFVNICVVILLAISAWAVVNVVSRSDDNPKVRSWWRENETTIVVTVISITFPQFFELLGFLEHYHPRKQLRLQLARIMLLNLLNLYSLIFALFSKIDGMSEALDSLKPTLNMNASKLPVNFTETLTINITTTCTEIMVPCPPHHIIFTVPTESIEEITTLVMTSPYNIVKQTHNYQSYPEVNNLEMANLIMKQAENKTINLHIDVIPIKPLNNSNKYYPIENLVVNTKEDESTTASFIDPVLQDELKRLREIVTKNGTVVFNESSAEYDDDYTFDTALTLSDYYETSQTISSEDFNTNTVTNYYTETSPIEQSTYEKNTDSLIESTTQPYDDIYSTTEETTVDLTLSETDSARTTSEETISTEAVQKVPTFSYTMEENTIPSTENPLQSTHTSTTVEQTTFNTWANTSNFFNINDLSSTISSIGFTTSCPIISFNCTIHCGRDNITQVFTILNCTVIERKCYKMQCKLEEFDVEELKRNLTHNISVDVAYIDQHNRKMYNLTRHTKKKLLKLCWETMFGQELVKLTMMDLVFVLLGTLFMDFFRALFVRYMNRCWCWDLEKKFPEYGDFKIAENILHLINNQGMVWMGMFFSPGLVVLNVFKLVIMMYLRSWAVMTCNVPHEVVFRVSKSNNFYLALLLTMLFLCVLPVGYSIVWVKPSWHCGPFSEYDKIYHILTNNIYKILPERLNFTLECISSPAIVIPLLVLLVLIIYYLTSLTNSLREANNDLKIQLRRERTEERRKMFQLADTRRRVGSSAMDNTPFARWKKALPTLPLSKSIESDEKTPGEEAQEIKRASKLKRGGIFAKIVNIALDRKSDVEAVPEIENDDSQSPNNDDTDTDFHETLPKDVLKFKDITVSATAGIRKKSDLIREALFKIKDETNKKNKLRIQTSNDEEKTDKKAVERKITHPVEDGKEVEMVKNEDNEKRKPSQKQASETSTQSQQHSTGSVIPVITISVTESDDETLHTKKSVIKKVDDKSDSTGLPMMKSKPDSKSLRRQSSVDSFKEYKAALEKKPEDGHKYQYSL